MGRSSCGGGRGGRSFPQKTRGNMTCIKPSSPLRGFPIMLVCALTRFLPFTVTWWHTQPELQKTKSSAANYGSINTKSADTCADEALQYLCRRKSSIPWWVFDSLCWMHSLSAVSFLVKVRSSSAQTHLPWSYFAASFKYRYHWVYRVHFEYSAPGAGGFKFCLSHQLFRFAAALLFCRSRNLDTIGKVFCRNFDNCRGCFGRHCVCSCAEGWKSCISSDHGLVLRRGTIQHSDGLLGIGFVVQDMEVNSDSTSLCNTTESC